ncbi:MAG: ubiquitin-like small modifier protein SAMP2 [Halobacteriota archaeon]
MQVTVNVLGEGSETVTVEDPDYGDLLAAVDLSPHEASVFVDGQPKPADGTVTEAEVEVVRLVRGG